MADERPDEEREREFREYAHEAANRPILRSSDRKALAQQQEAMKEAGPYLTLGVQMGLSIAAFFGVGYWLDHHFHSSPLWTAVLTGIGAVASLTYFIVTVVRLSQKTETKRR